MKRIKLRLTLDVTYRPGTADESLLREQLKNIVNHAADRGLMTGDTDAEVTRWAAKVTVPRK